MTFFYNMNYTSCFGERGLARTISNWCTYAIGLLYFYTRWNADGDNMQFAVNLRVSQGTKELSLFHSCMQNPTAPYVFRSRKKAVAIVIQQPPCVFTGKVRPSKIVDCKIHMFVLQDVIKIRPHTTRKSTYDH